MKIDLKEEKLKQSNSKINIRLRHDLWRDLDALKKITGLTRQRLIELAIESFIASSVEAKKSSVEPDESS